MKTIVAVLALTLLCCAPLPARPLLVVQRDNRFGCEHYAVAVFNGFVDIRCAP